MPQIAEAFESRHRKKLGCQSLTNAPLKSEIIRNHSMARAKLRLDPKEDRTGSALMDHTNHPFASHFRKIGASRKWEKIVWDSYFLKRSKGKGDANRRVSLWPSYAYCASP